MKFYTSDGCSYEGMDEGLITALRAELGKTTTFVDQPTYEAYLALMEAQRVQ